MDTTQAQARASMYGLLATIFLTLPDKDFVARLRQASLDSSGPDESEKLLAAFFEERKDLDDDKVLEVIMVDRTRVVRAYNKAGIRPPYEALYVGALPQMLIQAMNHFYESYGFALAEGLTERCDHIGTELSFLQMLCLRESKESVSQDELTQLFECECNFFSEHLGRWVFEYADGIYEYAKTDFFRAIACMLQNFMTSEKEYFGL